MLSAVWTLPVRGQKGPLMCDCRESPSNHPVVVTDLRTPGATILSYVLAHLFYRLSLEMCFASLTLFEHKTTVQKLTNECEVVLKKTTLAFLNVLGQLETNYLSLLAFLHPRLNQRQSKYFCLSVLKCTSYTVFRKPNIITIFMMLHHLPLTTN